jgi:hypothetical protein
MSVFLAFFQSKLRSLLLATSPQPFIRQNQFYLSTQTSLINVKKLDSLGFAFAPDAPAFDATSDDARYRA